MFRKIRNIGLIVGAILAASPCPGLTLPELEKSYEARCSRILEGKRDSLEVLRKNYLGTLQGIAAKYQRAGLLDEVLLVKKEAKSIEAGEWPLSAIPKEISLETNAPRKIFLRKHIEIDQQTAKDLVQAADTMAKALDAQTVSLTKSGELVAAKLAQTIKDGLEKNPEVASARDLLANAGTNGTSPPACRVRRSGDAMEVIVFFDSRGQISAESPVKNLREKDKEIGDTDADTLGRFIGSKDYETTPYVAYRKNFEKGDESRIDPFEMLLDPARKIDETKGLALSLKPNAVNPFSRFPPVLSPKSAGGKFRITCIYHIPKPNRAVTGFHFIQGTAGGPYFGGKSFTKTGEWVTETMIAEALNESPLLLLYFELKPGAEKNDNTADSVVLSSILVEHLTFSAFVTERFATATVEAKEYPDPAQQPQLARDGELLPLP